MYDIFFLNIIGGSIVTQGCSIRKVYLILKNNCAVYTFAPHHSRIWFPFSILHACCGVWSNKNILRRTIKGEFSSLDCWLHIAIDDYGVIIKQQAIYLGMSHKPLFNRSECVCVCTCVCVGGRYRCIQGHV